MQPPKNAVQVIQEATAKGATKKGAAYALGVSHETFDRWLTEFPELQQAFDQGKERERQTLHDALIDIALNGTGKERVTAILFALKARHGYREGEQEAVGNRVQINFQLPGAMPADAYVIENGGQPCKRLS